MGLSVRLDPSFVTPLVAPTCVLSLVTPTEPVEVTVGEVAVSCCDVDSSVSVDSSVWDVHVVMLTDHVRDVAEFVVTFSPSVELLGSVLVGDVSLWVGLVPATDETSGLATIQH